MLVIHGCEDYEPQSKISKLSFPKSTTQKNQDINKT